MPLKKTPHPHPHPAPAPKATKPPFCECSIEDNQGASPQPRRGDRTTGLSDIRRTRASATLTPRQKQGVFLGRRRLSWRPRGPARVASRAARLGHLCPTDPSSCRAWGPGVSSRRGRRLPGPSGSGSRKSRVLSFFSSLVELKSDRGKSGAGLRPGRSARPQRLGRFLLEEPGLGRDEGAGGRTPRDQTALSRAKQERELIAVGGAGRGPGRPRDT